MKKIIVIFSLLTTIPIISYAQNIKQFFSASAKEKCWFITHPFSISKTLKIKKVVLQKTDSIIENNILDTIRAGGKADAFRHALWMSLMIQEMPERRARRLGIAHEKTNYKQFKKDKTEDGAYISKPFSDMDLQNNEIGIKIGLENKGKSTEKLIDEIISRINAGELWILAKDNNDNIYTCDGEKIDIVQYKGIWETPICILKSNQEIPVYKQ